MAGYLTERGQCARLTEDFEKVYSNVFSKVLENALITPWSAAENVRSILGDIINYTLLLGQLSTDKSMDVYFRLLHNLNKVISPRILC